MNLRAQLLHLFAFSVLMILIKSAEVQSCRAPANFGQGCTNKIERISRTKLFQQIKKSGQVIHDYSLWFTGRPFVFHGKGDVKNRKLKSAYYDFLVPILKTFSPIKTFQYDPNFSYKLKPDIFLFRGPAQKIFDKLWLNPNMILSIGEIKTLSKYKLIKRFQQTQSRLKQHPYQHRAAMYGEQIFFWAKFFSFFAGTVYMYEQSKTGMPHIIEFIQDEKYKLDKYQVQILIDSVPFPHLGIRMGDVVYSYGQTHLSRREMITYFDSAAYQKMLKELYPESFQQPNPPENSNLIDQTSFHVNNSMAALADKTGLSSMTKTLTAITLNLSKEEYDNLKKHFESHRGSRYRNLTMINDCASMVTRALKQHTTFKFNQIIDASPGQVGIALSLMKASGDKRIGDIYQVSMAENENTKPSNLLLRNTYIHMLESKLFISWFLYNQGLRLIVDGIYDETELTYLEKAVEQYWQETWQKEMQQYFEQDPRISFLEDLVSIAKYYYQETPEEFSKQIKNIQDIAQEEFDQMFFESKIGDQTDFYDQKRYAYRNNSIKKYCNDFKKNISLQFPDLEKFELSCEN